MTTKETVMYSFHCTLEEIATAKGISAAEITEGTGLSKNTVKRHWENNPILTRIDAGTVMRLQEYLNLDDWHQLFKPHMTETLIRQRIHRPQTNERNREGQ